MEEREEEQLVPEPILRKEREEAKELPLEDLDMPVSQLLKMYKSREIPRRWSAE